MEKQDTRIKIFAIAKDEAAYIPQWVHHHFYFGFDEIEIWLNNIEDNSIEVCKRLSNTYENFKYKVADDILEECKKQGAHFQKYCYNEIFKTELDNGKFTHIFYLDLDEMWIPKDFKSNIHEYMNSHLDKDSISFSWYFDNAGYDNLLFSNTFESKQKVYKNQHVKSLLRITDRVNRTGLHNHSISGGKYILQNGDIFDVDNLESMNGAIVPANIFNDISQELDSSFIYHTVFRSQVEYVSTLLRGRRHVTIKAAFKDNRWGYKNQGKEFKLNIDSSLLQYNKSYIKFLDRNSLFKELIKAQNFIIDRFYKAKILIELSKEKNDTLFKKILHNVCLLGMEKYGCIDFSIDRIIKNQDESVVIDGWIAKKNSNKEDIIDISFFKIVNGKKSRINGYLIRKNRPDVLEKVNKCAPLLNGFNFTFEDVNIYSEELKVRIMKFDGLNNRVDFLVE